jgi:hypothetical protein
MEFFTELVGVSFRPAFAKEVVGALELGDELVLELDPENKYDPHAIKVIDHNSGEFIGFIRAADAVEISAALIDYENYSCTVISFLGKWRLGLKIVFEA